MKKKIIGAFVSLLALAILAAPVYAGPPTKGTYTQVIVDHTIVPSEEFQTGDVLHTMGGISEYYEYGGPLGNSISSLGVANGVLNLVSLTGTSVGHGVATYAAGTVERNLNIKYIGTGGYVYLGPTFTFTLGEVTATVTTGDIFGGILYDFMAVKHGTGDLAGFTSKGTGSGVAIYLVVVGDPNMVGMTVNLETGTYSW